MANTRRPYQHLPNNLALTRGHFTSQFWYAAATNAQHYGDCRLRLAAGFHGHLLPIAGLPSGSAFETDLAPYMPFDAFDMEVSYRVACVWATNARDGFADLTVSWRVRTEDSAGANAAAGPITEQRISLEPPPGQDLLGRLRRLDWPQASGQGYHLVRSAWVDHAIDPALPADRRIMRITGYADALNLGAPKAWLYGVIAYGYRGGM
jgi:hypothetical protein